MSSPVRERIADEAAEFGFRLVRLADRRSDNIGGNPHAQAWEIACSGCRAAYKAAWGPDTSPSLMVRNMHKKGWDVRAKRAPLCPTCIRQRKVIPMNTRASGAHAGASAPLAVAMNVAVSAKITRTVFSILEDRFDEAKRLYRDGWTDERTAKEAGTTVEIVQRLRREAFGELAEDPRVTAFKDDLALLRLDIEQAMLALGRRCDEMASRLTGLGGGGI